MNSLIPRMLIEQLTEMYIPEESKKFVEEVDRISDEMQDLLDFKLNQ